MTTSTGQGSDPVADAVTGDPASPVEEAEIGWGVGAVAARLGIPASTLRTWERRYDVGPTRRTAGGHRRYTETDIDRVDLTQQLIGRGAPPADAARVAHSLDAAGLAAALSAEEGGEDDSATPETVEPATVVDEIVLAAQRSDTQRLARLAGDALRRDGAVGAWTSILAPTLIRIGHEWSIGALGIEAEHLASNAIVGELRAYTRSVPSPDGTRATVILASAEDDQHALPVFALEAALAEAGLPAHVLGPRFPAEALASLVTQVSPDVVFLWASIARSEEEPIWDVLASIAESTAVVLGGPGWPREIEPRLGGRQATVPADLASTVERIVDLVG